MQEDRTTDQKNRLLREIIEVRLSAQMASADAFSTRAGLTLATAGVVLTAYAQLLTDTQWACGYMSYLFIPEICMAIASGYYSFSSLSLGSEEHLWRHDPNPAELYKLSKKVDSTKLEDQALQSMIDAYDENNALSALKYEYLIYARRALFVSGAIFAAHLTLFIIL